MNKARGEEVLRMAVVTGGNRGIGKEIARQLAAKGLQVLITSRDEEKGRLAVQELLAEGLRVKLHVADVHEIRDVAGMMNRIQSDYGRLDVLVNNAGVILDRGGSVLDVEESVVRATLETNFFGALRMTQAAIPLMKQHQYGRIVNISSGLGAFEIMQGGYGLQGSSAAYRISKTMLNALTCLVSQDVANTGIKVNAVCPGRVQTDMGGADAPLTVAEGADTAVWLATMEDDGPSGNFFRERQTIAW